MKPNYHPRRWLLVALTFSVLIAGLYLVIQQSLRLAANEPQASMALDTANDIANNGANPMDAVKGYIDIASDMAPFVIVYDQYGQVIVGNGYIDGKVPKVPVGVLAAAKGNKAHAVTWAPQEKLRIASVSAQAGDKYVLAGRNLFVVEHTIQKVGRVLAVGWVVGVVLLAMLYKLFNRPPKPLATPESAAKKST